MKAQKISARQAYAGTLVGFCMAAFVWAATAFLKK